MKHPKRSKTLWANAIMTALLAAELNVGLLRAWLGEEVYGVVSFAIILVNVVLRFVTTGPISLKASPNA
jgi:hypothetical protein